MSFPGNMLSQPVDTPRVSDPDMLSPDMLLSQPVDTPRTVPQGPMPGDMLGIPVDTPRVTDPFNFQPGSQPQTQFPTLMQNPAFNPQAQLSQPPVLQTMQTLPQVSQPPQIAQQPAQQLQQIAQGVPSLVNLLSPIRTTMGQPPGAMSITTAPRSMPQAQPRFPGLQQNPAFSQPPQNNMASLIARLGSPLFAPGPSMFARPVRRPGRFR